MEDELNILLQEIVNNAVHKTDQQLENELSSLTRLTDSELKQLINSGISKKDLASVIKECKDNTKSNQQKAEAISNINGGLNAIIQIVGKFI